MRTPEDTPTDADQLIRFGTIASADLKAARIVVSLDDDSTSPPIRWVELRMGRTRTWSPPGEGEQVVLLCPAGEIGAAIALRGLTSDAFAPLGDDLTEIIEFLDGARVSYDPEAHAFAIVLPGGATFRVVASGGATFDGPLHCTGDITSDGDVKAGGISLTNHIHDKVQAGSAVSGKPVA